MKVDNNIIDRYVTMETRTHDKISENEYKCTYNKL